MTIDWWTLGLQAINVAVLIWLLQRFFWRPVAAIIEARRTAAQKTLADAEASKAKAAAALAEIENTRAGFAKEREAILAAACQAAEQARGKIMAEATAATAALETGAKATIERERRAAEAAWSDHSTRLAVEIARRLAARLDGPAVRTSFLDWLLKAIADLPQSQRQASSLVAVSATLLGPAEQEHAASMIAQAFGGTATVTFNTDPSLIAGLELHTPNFIISNSWRADLDKILADITHGP